MKESRLKSKEQKPVYSIYRRLSEGGWIFTLALSAFLWISLLSYHPMDSGWSHTGIHSGIQNLAGRTGAYLSDFCLHVFGYPSYLFPVMALYFSLNGLWRLRHKGEDFGHSFMIFRIIGFFFVMIGSCGLFSLHNLSANASSSFTSGGYLGHSVGFALALNLNFLGTILLLMSLLLSGFTLMTGLSWLSLIDGVGESILWIFKLAFRWTQPRSAIIDEEETARKYPSKVPAQKSPKISKPIEPTFGDFMREKPVVHLEKAPIQVPPSRAKSNAELGMTGTLPNVALLDDPEPQVVERYSSAHLEQMAKEVEKRLKEYNVDAHVVAVHPGPVITRFELELAPGVKVSKLTSLVKDLARSLSVISVRVVEVIPGKAVVGLEIPNEHREIVRLKEVMCSTQYEQSRSPLSLVLGKDISGHPVIVDLAKMPHLLVAGTTGSGKSVGLNAMLLSLLFKATPEEVRMIMIDPKMLELSIYDRIQHLLVPVVTDMRDAANALRWCVTEMERRYRLMATLGVRNLSSYNKKIKDAEASSNPLVDPWQPEIDGKTSYLQSLPYIVIVIDEFADMMMIVGKKVEELIARIAQKARAAGIHMILATQRPSVDVITGLIKANISTRIAFQVSSKIDSRTILDQQGAEQLLGHGDMLYLSPGAGIPMRVHGAFVADHEVHAVVQSLREMGEPRYIDDVTEDRSNETLRELSDPDNVEENDPLYDQAVDFVIESRKASISSLQRRFKIGYNRAARIIEQMEKVGIVSPMETNGNREILVPIREAEE